jgi:hypothetical protein
MTSTTAIPNDRVTGQIVDFPTLELTASGKFVVWFSIISILFLTQIAYNIGEFPVSFDLISYGVFTAYLVITGYSAPSYPSIFLLVCAIALALFRIPYASSSTSWSSLLLLCVLYIPFSFRLARRPHLQPVADYIVGVTVAAASVITLVGIAQIVLVNAARLSSLTNIYFVLPEAIRGAGTYTHFREGGGIVKANGFFLRESADLSFVAAVGIILEYRSKKRLRVLILLAAGLLASFSGTGLLILAAGLLLPRSVSRIPAFVTLSAGLLLVLFALRSVDNPFLNLWFDRLSEFGTPNTSAYARFQAPLNMLERSFDKGILTTWFGNGAGSLPRDVGVARLRYEVADPTWAKLVYEYGIIGFALFLAILVLRLYSSSTPVEVCNLFLFGWISTSFLLKPGYVLMLWLLTLVPSLHQQTAKKMTELGAAPDQTNRRSLA